MDELSRFDKHPRVRAEKVEGVGCISRDERDAAKTFNKSVRQATSINAVDRGDYQVYLRG